MTRQTGRASQPWKRHGSATILLLALGGTAGYVAADQYSTPEGVPRLITYEGFLTRNGTPVTDGTHTLRFELFTSASGGTPMWTSVRNLDTVAGHFAVTLGDTTGAQPALVLSDFLGGDLYLQVAVQTGASTYEVVGRQRVTSTPYALRAATAATASTAAGATGALEARLSAGEAAARSFAFCLDANGAVFTEAGDYALTVVHPSAGNYSITYSPTPSSLVSCVCSVQQNGFVHAHIASHRPAINQLDLYATDSNGTPINIGSCCICAQ